MRRMGGSSGMGWGGAGSGGGAAGGGGGGMFRTVSRVARAGMSNLQDPSSSSSSSSSNSPRKASNSKLGLTLCNTTTAIAPSLVSLSSSVQGFGPAWPRTSPSSLCDESEWVCVQDEFSIDDANDSFDGQVFGSAPSSLEVTSALLSLQQALPSSSSSESDWIEPSWQMYSTDQRIYPGIGSVYHALHLLQTDSSVQRMVISLSSDRAVWDAVLNNLAVQELRESLYQGEAYNSDEESNSGVASANIVSWIFNNMRSKLMEFVTGITNLMKEAFQPPEHQQQQQADDFPDRFGEKVTAAFMLTAIVLLIVVVSRASHSQA